MTKEHTESICDLFKRLEAAGADPGHLRAVADHTRRENNMGAPRLDRLYFGKGEGERVSLEDIATELEQLHLRASGVELAVQALADGGASSQQAAGAEVLMRQVVADIERLHLLARAEPAANRPRLPGEDDAIYYASTLTAARS
ncbi:hypothetical protein [Methylocystis bryophila]|uniref:Uncharacterized protein n=1 Tax=Methylocystis bryophila TaxID=655015 RepID=A0A1W6MW73_9HYPH|nr:hypothetical protein [Methylocystis bryophila]ARN81842.1 hypothetical protein B1812_12970 [Methylocystis bryophila]BDV37916.1 hypothetical protein DSM21852_11690 [Methylocystis bryophila]